MRKRKKERKKEQDLAHSAWPKNWQCGMKIKGGINSKEKRDPFKVY